MGFIPLAADIGILFSASSYVFSPPFRRIYERSLFLLEQGRRPPRGVALRATLLDMANRGNRDTSYPSMPLHNSGSWSTPFPSCPILFRGQCPAKANKFIHLSDRRKGHSSTRRGWSYTKYPPRGTKSPCVRSHSGSTLLPLPTFLPSTTL